MTHRKSPLDAVRPQRCAREGELVFSVTRHGAMVSERGPAGQRTVLPAIGACVHLPRKTGKIEQAVASATASGCIQNVRTDPRSSAAVTK